MTPIARLAAACLLLAGCTEEAPVAEAENEAQTAEGEVLGGTISDDMLPLATVTSQPPALQERERSSPNPTAPEPASQEPEETPVPVPEPEPPAQPANPVPPPEETADES